MRDVISNETIKEINEVIDEILTNIDDNVRNIVGAGNYSLPTIFSYTNYSGQTINVHGSTFRHEIIIDNADGNNLIGDICTVIGDRKGIKLAKAGVEDRHDTFANYWDSSFDIAYDSDTAINGYVFDMHSGLVGEGTGQSKVMSFKLDNLKVGKAYTITFRGKFVHAQFVSGQESLVRICSTTAETPYLAQVTLEKDMDAHIYRIDFTNNTQDTTLYLNFWFYGVDYDIETYNPEFIADDLIIVGMSIGIISRYIDYNGKWYPIEAGGGTSDLDAIELTYAEYQALTPAEKTDPDKIYFITDYPSGSGVVINPTGTATDTAETIEVDGTIYDFADTDAVHTADIGVAGGVAELDANGKVPSAQLPTYPTVGNGTITIQKNGTNVDTFTTNQSSNKTVNITMSKSDVGLGNVPNVTTDNQEPTVTEASTRANIATGDTLKTIIGKIKKFFSDLKAVAFSGSYNDLSDKPTIPTVNNGTLTIKQNNTNLGTFTANQSTASNINIECAVPSDVEGSKVATGNPITITDGSETYAEELVVDLEPIQSGSGTPSPSNVRPIQGYDIVSVDRCGKNLFDKDSSEIVATSYLFDDGSIGTPASNWIISGWCPIIGGYPITLYNQGSAAAPAICWYDLNKNFIGGQAYNGVSSAITVTPPKNAAYVRFSCHKDYVNTAQLEIGSQATTYTAFTGNDKVNIQLGNKNLLPMTVEGIKAANTSGTWSGNVYTRNNVSFTVLTDENGCVTGIRCKGDSSGSFPFFFFSGSHTIPSNCKYNISASKSSSNWDTTVRNGNTDIAYIDAISGVNGDVAVTDTTFTLAFVYFNASFNDDIILHPMIRYSTDNPTFSPYNPTLGGMIYGGQLTLKDDGSVDVECDRVYREFTANDSNTWNLLSGYSNTFYCAWTKDSIAPTATGTDGVCSSYNVVRKATSNLANGEITLNNTGISSSYSSACVKDAQYSTAANFKASLTTPLQIVYPLATPFTIYLSAEQLKLLKGYNYISSNGTTIHLTYQPDNAVGDAVSKAEKYTDRLCKTGVVDTFNLYNGNTKVGSVSLLSNGFKLLYISSIDDGSVFGMNIPDKYVPKGPYQRAVICFEDSYANPRIIEIYQNHITVTEDKFEHGDTYGTGLYY